MDKGQAIHSFWSQFGLPAYDQYTVPTGAHMPYISYSVSTGSIGNVQRLSASLWYYSTSWKDISQKAEEIANALTPFHVQKIDGGYIWFTQGAPFAQRMADTDDEKIRRIYINVDAECLTAS